MSRSLTLTDIRQDKEVDSFVRLGNQYLGAMGYTEHGFRHVCLVSERARLIMENLGFTQREVELAAIAGYMHDIGNVINRVGHSQSGAVMASRILTRMGMPTEETAIIMGAIGNHDESSGSPVNAIAAALILADKSDVHRSRVRNPDVATFDIHDRVNYAVEKSDLIVDGKLRTITVDLTIDIKMSPVMEYFEIFLSRMLLCRRAAEFLEARFGLIINESRLL